MKVLIKPDGTVEFDVDTTEQAIALARGVASSAQAEADEAEKREVSRELVSLTPKQRRLYDLMAELDCPEGCHLSGLAELTDATESAVSQMVNIMVKRGLAQRISRGHYRAVKPILSIGDELPRVRAV